MARKKYGKMMKQVRKLHRDRGIHLGVDYTEELLTHHIILITQEVEKFAKTCLSIVGHEPADDEKLKILLGFVAMSHACMSAATTFEWDFEEAFNQYNQALSNATDEELAGEPIKLEDHSEPVLKMDSLGD